MNTVIIANQELQIKEWNSEPVLTFKDIDRLHNRPDGTARKRFNDNRERFINEEDYYKICASEIRTHKLGDISNKTHEDITLITESGYLMLVKSFTDDFAWRVQRELIKCYFRVKSESIPEQKHIQAESDDVIFNKCMIKARNFVKLSGINKKIAALHALEEVEFLTGEDYSGWKNLLLPYIKTNDTLISDDNYVSAFFTEFQDKFVWNLLPINFLYDLFLVWYKRSKYTDNPEGRNTFKNQLEQLISNDENSPWKVNPSAVRTTTKMSMPELLILEYNLVNWKNTNYKGKDPNKICVPVIGDFARGIVRRAVSHK